ncbi:MAG: hypothetical protein EOP07_00280 [Proteobacteria bacterium]|nr:MAG: hypothetical protein EOP07_00280 [Pseudomonadota bacterium]
MQDIKKPSSQSGASMVVIIVGLALSTISIGAASTFFVQKKRQAVSLQGDSEALNHWSLMLRHAFSDKSEKNCLQLDDLKVAFDKSLGGKEYKIWPGKLEKTAAQRQADGPNPDDKLSYIRNSMMKSYEIFDLAMIQRSGIIGEDPGRVLVDLRLRIIDRATKKRTEFKVPMLLDVGKDRKSIGCMQKPKADEICAKNKGTFNEKNTDAICKMGF